jgi:hypothetical protein
MRSGPAEYLYGSASALSRELCTQGALATVQTVWIHAVAELAYVTLAVREGLPAEL